MTTASLLIKCGYISSNTEKTPTSKLKIRIYRAWNKILCAVSQKHKEEVSGLLYTVYKSTIEKRIIKATKYHGKGKLPRKKNVRL